MLDQNPSPRRLRPRPGTADAVCVEPSHAARSRLEDALRDRAGAYRTDASVDLTLVDALLRMGQPEAAARTLDDHRASLRAMVHDLQAAVADAAVERDVERVCWTAAAQGRFVPRGGLKQRVLAATGAAAVFLALALPSGRISPKTILAGIEDRMTQAREGFGTSVATTDRPAARDIAT